MDLNTGRTVTWTEMADGTADDYLYLDALYRKHSADHIVDSLLGAVRMLEGPMLGYQVDRARHSRQSATRALRNGEPVDMVVAALLHDIGDVLAPDNHSALAASVVAPYVDEEITWVIRHHGVFQGYYYFHHLDHDRNAREQFRSSPFYDRCVDFCASYDQNCFDPNYPDLPLEEFRPLVAEVFSRPSRLAVAGEGQA
ncbi:MAG: HD domain-containing protein [Acidimicrobiia bacterium]|nr:HD domain-containing protein [Acidimicrobiia bacterium]